MQESTVNEHEIKDLYYKKDSFNWFIFKIFTLNIFGITGGGNRGKSALSLKKKRHNCHWAMPFHKVLIH